MEKLINVLDSLQLGVIYESLLLNESENPESEDYALIASEIKAGIEANCGWEDYCAQTQKTAQAIAKQMLS